MHTFPIDYHTSEWFSAVMRCTSDLTIFHTMGVITYQYTKQTSLIGMKILVSDLKLFYVHLYPSVKYAFNAFDNVVDEFTQFNEYHNNQNDKNWDPINDFNN